MLKAYCQLMRWHQPVGFWLLWWPIAWALWLANHGAPSGFLLGVFALGAWLMRSAGCVINDWADRAIDGQVARTASRPLVQGHLSGKQVLALGLVLLFLACVLLFLLPWSVVPWAMGAGLLAALYPFTKRWFHGPQLVLGVAFASAIPMVWVASGEPLGRVTAVLVVAVVLLTVAYDTLYAMADYPDDCLAGIKTPVTALGPKRARWLVFACTQGFYALWVWLLLCMGATVWGWCMVGGAWLVHLAAWVWVEHEPMRCFRLFRAHAWLGLWFWLVLVLQLA